MLVPLQKLSMGTSEDGGTKIPTRRMGGDKDHVSPTGNPRLNEVDIEPSQSYCSSGAVVVRGKSSKPFSVRTLLDTIEHYKQVVKV